MAYKMEKEKVLQEIAGVFDEVFENHGITITEETTAQDIAEWNSLTNIELIVAIEKNFGIQFRSADIQNLRNVGDLCKAVVVKLNS